VVEAGGGERNMKIMLTEICRKIKMAQQVKINRIKGSINGKK
jgi:hypothetical protein